MVVQHNMQAANASRMLGITTTAQGKTTEKLSSGFRINRAADDAAGLSISEKMRKQIRGLDQASTNASDGISAVQTAEGALTEVHAMLQRMNELAVQAANGTNAESDRQSIQDEILQLTTEIDRVAETTKFNETYLLRGDPNGTKITKAVNAHDAGLAGTLVANGKGETTFSVKERLKDGTTVSIGGKVYEIGMGKTEDSYKTATALGATAARIGDSITVDGKDYVLTNKVKATDITSEGTGEHQYKPAMGDLITTKDGKVYQYYVKFGETGATADSPKKVETGWYEKKSFQDTDLYQAEGHKVSIGSIATEGSTIRLKDKQSENGMTTFAITKNLGEGEVSTWKLGTSGKITMNQFKQRALNNTSATIAAGDTIITNGEILTAVHDDFVAQKLADVSKQIGALASGTTVTIADIDGNNSVTYTVVENSDQEAASDDRLTRGSIVGLLKEGQRVTIGSATMTVAGVDSDDEDKISAQYAYSLMAEELQKASSIGTDTEAKVTNNNDGTFLIKQGTVSYASSLTFNLHVGSDADMTNKINVEIDTMNAAYLGIKKLNVADDTGISATYAIDAIADALARVSAQRSALGAVQNRLEHSIANLDNVVENSQAAESRIRDADMADEMVTYSKNNILAQAGQSMLAQANQSTQGVMSILQ
ncbi:flagellin [Pseudobutyrivibrio sp. OR37]|nr:flagellin [Pseudobutyrivibrio sp. OR37]SFI06832.1 flagellin [Pseudobutyrivibrio sp. OR37]